MINRIQLILKTKNLSPSQFADQIQVQRSGVSHILSARNNPSLDFILKVLKTFPEIDADWLLFGKGQMVNLTSKHDISVVEKIDKIIKVPAQTDLFAEEPTDNPKPNYIQKEIKTPATPLQIPQQGIETLKEGETEKIEKIVVFYSDTFKEYKPK